MKEIALFFLKLGCLGFGGPIATVAMMETETVQKRRWLSPQHFARGYALVKVLPGPVSTQMAIYLGQVRGGRWGGVIAGSLFILPGFFLLLLLSYFYEKLHSIPSAENLFSGMQVAALVVIADSVSRMARPHVHKKFSVLLALVCGVVIFLKPQFEPLLVLGFGLMGAVLVNISTSGIISGVLAAGTGGVAPFGDPGFWQQPTVKVFLVCLKAGFLVFGTGLAVVPVLEVDVVSHYHWLTHSEFVDGLALGQVTPGPVVLTATFIGFKVAGLMGAVMATFAIFLPGFFNILLLIPMVEKKIENSPRLIGFTDWAIPVVIGGIVATSLRLGFMTIHSISLVILVVAAALVQFILRPPVWSLIPLSGLIYFCLGFFFH